MDPLVGAMCTAAPPARKHIVQVLMIILGGKLNKYFFPTILACSTVSQLCSSAQSIVCGISPLASIALNQVREYLLYVISMDILVLLDLVRFTFSVGRQQADNSPCLSEVCQDGVQGL